MKKLSFLLGTGIIIGILGIVYIAFSSSFDRVYGLLLEKDMIQTEFTSKFVTRLIETEIENVMASLQVSQGVFLKRENEDLDQMKARLNALRIELKFEEMGICDLEGVGIDCRGGACPAGRPGASRGGIPGAELYFKCGGRPGYDLPGGTDREESGGHYQVERIAETIELDTNSHRYFQIVDDSGEYISDSHNVNSFARDENVWDEIAKYQLSGGMTEEEIRKDVEEGRSGAFHFTHHGSGRYVNYEPLGINNWYAFSVLREDYVTGYVKEIEKIFTSLLRGILICLVVFFVFIVGEIYRTTALIREKNATLTSRNSLLFMVLKHTNDIPFEVDFARRSVTLYHMNSQDQLVGFLENYDEQVCQNEKMKEISRKSQLDPLTSLYNRAYFKYEVEKILGKGRFFQDSGYSALFLPDLDHFKLANDTLGHMVGDEILKESAMAMRHSVRSTDLCGRLCGDEFVLFIENVRDMEAVQRCASKLNTALRRTYGTGERRGDISASTGVAVLTEETGFDELYHLADVALYRVKNSGRDGFYVISKDTEREMEEGHKTKVKDQI